MSHQKPSRRAPDLVHSNFFVLRTPLLPGEVLTGWSENLTAAHAWQAEVDPNTFESSWKQDVQTLRLRLASAIALPEIVHALYVASPSLQAGIEHWKRDPDSKKGLQAERALVRYFERMAARPTPFGLFSGCSVGQVNDNPGTTALVLKRRLDYRVCCRLDFDYLFALTTALRKDRGLEKELQYFSNSSLYKLADAWYYVESRMSGAKRTHHLVKIDSDAYLEAVLTRAHGGAKASQLVETILQTPGEANPSEEEAWEYVFGLIRDNEILVSNLHPLVTGPLPLDDIISNLESLPSGQKMAESLCDIRNRLSGLDGRGLGSRQSDYEAITRQLEKFPAKIDPARLYQVDMIKPVQEGVLGSEVIAELTNAVEILARLGPASEPEELKSFRESFANRYEMAMVPLMEVLDEESGIGFSSNAQRTDASPLLRGLGLNRTRNKDSQASESKVAPELVRKCLICIQSGKSELELDLSDLSVHDGEAPDLPEAFCVAGALVAKSSDAIRIGDFTFYLQGAVGPSGVRMLGRFCHDDPQIEEGVRRHLKQEESHNPEAAYAEVVHLPEGWIGNVLCRPVLRDYEIPYLGRSGAPADRQLPVSDLLVGIERGDIVLYSRRLGRRVIPRLTNAHGFVSSQLSSVYRFLCYLQHQHGTSISGFSWGPLEMFDYLPRIKIGRVVISLARWRLSRQEIESVSSLEGSKRFAALQKLRMQRRLPRWVVYHESDNALPVDLDNVLSVDAFVHVLKRRSQGVLSEMYPPPDHLCIHGPEGSFYHELIVPFVRRPPTAPTHPSAPSGTPKARGVNASVLNREGRVLPPGSEWLYLKVYGGVGILDEILATALPPLIRRMTSSGCALKWFFIRYSDPHDHLRIRFNGRPERLTAELLPQITATFNPLLSSGKLWKIEFDTYQREVERYGGMDGIRAAEEIFFADSEAVLQVLQELSGDEGLDFRWRIGILGIDRLLSDFGLNERMKWEALGQWSKRSQAEFNVDMSVRRQLAERFRTERRRLESLLDGSAETDRQLKVARQAFELRSARNAESCQRIRQLAIQDKLTESVTRLASSYVHMHINRLIRASQRAHEVVMYDFMAQLYGSRLAKKPTARK